MGTASSTPPPKYGLAVVGEVDQGAILRKGGGRAGALLVLTKPLSAGVVGTVVKRGQASSTAVSAAVTTMTRSNAAAAAVATAAGLRGGTDVTGYGLVGHPHEMTLAAGVEARIWPAAVPLLPEVSELVRHGSAPDGSRRTLADALGAGWFLPGIAEDTTQLLLADAQTSGGLVLCVPPDTVTSVLTALRDAGDGDAAVITGPAWWRGSRRSSPRAASPEPDSATARPPVFAAWGTHAAVGYAVAPRIRIR